MAGANLRSITTNGEYYKKIFQLFCAKCNKTEVDKAWAEQVFPSIVMDKLRQPLENIDTFRSLGIGSGTGDFEISMLRQLSSRYSDIHQTVVEPAKSFIERYQSLLSSNGADLKGVRFDWREQTMQNFQKATKEGQFVKYHFISSVHSVYYADDITDTIRFFHGLLEEGGILMIAVTTDHSSNTKFFTRFPVILDHNPHITLINSAHIKQSLDILGLPCVVHTQSSAADIASIFDESSQEGNSFLDFLTHTIDFRSTAPAQLLAEVLAYLKSDECCQLGDDGTVLFKNPWDTFIIQKSD